jgi:NAD(P)H-dependent FMN reductase
MLKLKIIIASTRPARKGPAVANWINSLAQQHKEFDTELIDLKEINLPFFDEPFHPRSQKYEHQHTKDWSAKIETAEAFIIVTPEYNYGFTAPLKNAFDYLYNEWAHKPVAFVSYGGLAAGTRAVQMFLPVMCAVKMVHVPADIHIASFDKYIQEDKTFRADEIMTKKAETMFKDLAIWTENLNLLRANIKSERKVKSLT